MCEIQSCTSSHTHATRGHKCDKCGKYGHGINECGNYSKILELDKYKFDRMPIEKQCTIYECSWKWNHSIEYHHCHKCKDLNNPHSSLDCYLLNFETILKLIEDDYENKFICYKKQFYNHFIKEPNTYIKLNQFYRNNLIYKNYVIYMRGITGVNNSIQITGLHIPIKNIEDENNIKNINYFTNDTWGDTTEQYYKHMDDQISLRLQIVEAQLKLHKLDMEIIKKKRKLNIY